MGPLSGSITFDSHGDATIAVSIKADHVTEGPETVTLRLPGVPSGSDGFHGEPVTVNDTSTAGSLGVSGVVPGASDVSEGSTATFTVHTTDGAGTVLPYIISGVQASDIVGGDLSGQAIVGSDGNATIHIPIAVDNLAENETLKVTVDGVSGSSVLTDSSVDPQATLTRSATSVAEGESVEFHLHAPNAAPGTSFVYNLGGAGITPSDIAGGNLSGSAIVDANGDATISIGLTDDGVVEGTENLSLTVSGKTQTISVTDSSVGSGTPNPPATATYTVSFFDMDRSSLLLPTNLETDTVQVVVNGVTVQGNAFNLEHNIESLTGLPDSAVGFAPGSNAGNLSNSVLTVTLPYGEAGITGASFVDGDGSVNLGPPVYRDASGIIVHLVAIPNVDGPEPLALS
jgi:hypothetical protein